eukprot:245846_1
MDRMIMSIHAYTVKKIKKWANGVWRVPVWPSFDLCTKCASSQLQQGTSKKETKYFDPTGNIKGDDMMNDIMNDGSHRGATHRSVSSDVALIHSGTMIKSSNTDDMVSNDENIMESLRKELSQIIEKISHEKIIRLENLSKWSQNEEQFEEFRSKTIEERESTNNEVNEWREK